MAALDLSARSMPASVPALDLSASMPARSIPDGATQTRSFAFRSVLFYGRSGLPDSRLAAREWRGVDSGVTSVSMHGRRGRVFSGGRRSSAGDPGRRHEDR
jgi:hypothetical protein